jgi:hypothetical protein
MLVCTIQKQEMPERAQERSQIAGMDTSVELTDSDHAEYCQSARP